MKLTPRSLYLFDEIVCLFFEVTAHLEALDVTVFVRAFEQHAYVVNRAYIPSTYIYDDTRVSLLLKRHLSTQILRFECDVRLSNDKTFLIQI